MKLFRVIDLSWDTAWSVFPFRDPKPEEESPFETEVAAVLPDDTLRRLLKYGYTQRQAYLLYWAIFNHYWYDYGIREVFHCRQMVNWWVTDNVAPIFKRAQDRGDFQIPPIGWFVVVIAAIFIVVVVIFNPEFSKDQVTTAPDNLYVGTYNEELWWLTRIGVSVKGIPWYEAVIYQGNTICIHERNVPYPPDVVDKIHIWGTMQWDFHIRRAYRRWRLGFMHAKYCGFLEHRIAHQYSLRSGGYDPWAPESAELVPDSQQCRIITPEHWYF